MPPSLSCRVVRATDDHSVIVNASARLPRDPTSLAHSEGMIKGLTSHGDQLFPGLCWFLFSDGQGPAALLPLQAIIETDGRLQLRSLRTPSRFEMLYCDAQIREDIDAIDVIEALLTVRAFGNQRCDVLRLRDMRAPSPFLSLAQAKQPRSIKTRPGSSLIETKQPYGIWLKQQSKNLRGQIKQSEGRLSAAGVLRVDVVASNQTTVAAFNRFVELEAKGYKSSLNALGNESSDCAVLRAALLDAGEGEKAIIVELYVGDSLAASQLALVRARRLYLIKVAFDEALSSSSPGTFLMSKLIEYCSEHIDIDEIDCCVRQQWHDRWRPRLDQAADANIPNTATLKGAALAVAVRTRGWLVR
jgi:hypothetical protein